MAERRSQAGVSLLEVMIALSLITVTIIAFASVFPAGYRLNNANNKQTRATKLANAIAEELRGFPNLVLAQGKTPSQLKTEGWIYTPFKVGVGQATAEEPFYIVDASNETGIKIEAMPTPNPNTTPALTAARITVTVTWQETRNNALVTQYATASSLATSTLKSSKY